MPAALDQDSPGPLLSLADYERAALAAMSPEARSYIEGGAADELTRDDNPVAWQRLALRPRMLVGASGLDLGTELLGVGRPHPIVVAPTAFQQLVHPDGEIGIARAAEATNTVMCVSTLASAGAAEVAQSAPQTTRWFQLYAFSDPGVTRELVDSAAVHGYEALVVTVDRPVLGLRERERRSRVRDAGAHAVQNSAAARGAPAADYSALIDADLSWADIERLVARSPLPVLVKGVMTAEDARLAIDHGVAGVIVSNHGGRQLDTVLSGADALPPVVDAVEGRVDVLVDGGIRRGTDIVKALALGARGVLVGRPLTWGLAVAGGEGAQHILQILLDELANALILTGCPRVKDLHEGFVTPAPWASRPA
ncbi:MAG: alpha-hydroxy acid oxidase [Solirubrobacteraceae bacterium]